MTSRSTLDAVERAFQALDSEPGITVDGSLIAWRAGPLTATELRGLVLHPGSSSRTRDRAVRLLLLRARRHGGPWTIALAGMLLPGLRSAVGGMVRAWPGRADDVEADALAALLEVIDSFDPAPRGVGPRLIWLAAARARRRLARELAIEGRPCPSVTPVEPQRPWGHPDFVLAEAVEQGVLSAADAELIGTTRIEGKSLRAVASESGDSEDRLWRTRRKAEQDLVRWLGREKSRGNGDAPRLLQGAGRPRT